MDRMALFIQQFSLFGRKVKQHEHNPFMEFKLQAYFIFKTSPISLILAFGVVDKGSKRR